MSEAIRVRVVVQGRVQGVFFRASTRDVALENDVCGWVRNIADGGVEAVLEGEREAVERVPAFMQRGPKFAAVKSCEIEYEEANAEFAEFLVKK